MLIHIFTPNRNKDGNDFEGAFKVEAERFERAHTEHQILRRELDYTTSMADFQSLISEPCDWLVLFCHGGAKWIFKSDFQAVKFQPVFATYVTLFACSAAVDDYSVGAKLSYSPQTRWVDGHQNAGHTTSNPNVNRWVQGHNQQLLSSIKDAKLYPTWVKTLGDRHNSTFRFEFPLLNEAEIVEALRGL